MAVKKTVVKTVKATVSANGWMAHKDPAQIGVAVFTVIKGVRPVRVRCRKDVAPLFVAALKEWHKRVEKLEPGEVQGYAYREIRGGSSGTLSNHASGTAVDIWPARHPQNDRDGNLTAEQRQTILDIAKRFGLKSGGQFRSSPDWMHLELAVSPKKAAELMKELGL